MDNIFNMPVVDIRVSHILFTEMKILWTGIKPCSIIFWPRSLFHSLFSLSFFTWILVLSYVIILTVFDGFDTIFCGIFLFLILAHLSYAQDELLWSLFVRRPSVCPSIRPSVNIFKRLLWWSPWANFAQISYRASLGRGNEKLLKWSRSIDQDGRHAHIW